MPSTINPRSTAIWEGQPRLLARVAQASPCDGGSSAVGGSVIYDDEGFIIGRIYTMDEVCAELMEIVE